MSLFPRFTQEFSPLFRLLDDYDRASRHAFQSGGGTSTFRSFSPRFDVKETKEGYELHGEFPGIEQKDINIEWSEGNTLTISGRTEQVTKRGEQPQGFIEGDESLSKNNGKAVKDKEHQPTVEDEGATTQQAIAKASESGELQKHQENGTKFWVSERSVGEFHRSFSFPSRVDQDNVKASLKNGILSIAVPKAQAPKPRKINIE